MKQTKKLKVVVIGGGSSYTPELIEGLLTRHQELPISDLWLVDIDEGMEKATVIADLTKRMIAKAECDITVHLTTNRQQALVDADFVCSQFRAGRIEARLRDERIALKYRVIGQETNGLGGFSNACRTIPIALEIAKEMEALCPNAWLLNFTNPSGMVTEALTKYSKIKTVGLCNVPVNMERGAAEMLGVDRKDITMQIAGLNHLVWARKILHDGKDKCEEVINELLAGNDRMTPKNIPPFKWDEGIIKSLGMVPCAYLRYYYQLRDILDKEYAASASKSNRADLVAKVEAELLEIYKDPTLDTKPKLLEERGGAYYSEAACELMSSIHNNKRSIMHVNTRNNGAIQGLPDDCAVEVSSIITSSEIIPLNVAPFETGTLRLIQLMKEFETLTVEAAITGDINLAKRALMLNPIVDSGQHIDEALRETIRENIGFMPAFTHFL
ncbi:6-phospho-beta-glucosidase [Vibrio mediterranei]|uniref:6-phospho-beta-glucosidase n=2 Tax=Vibrio TaxID=662 RepID=A0ABX5DJC7_9VIBR|nr:6-phospho-beta-glucosidase [Vibrio mediterranei]MCG9659485.1 6-phospho-beta-glucosidase [Vibrio mediterranei]PCD89884.1 6-phospho-beta-glucosidase [Vibrio mediterranei]PRQ69273.1 6-phospho-beta-glucosidase [Vibrio mediterranei]